MSVQLEHGYTRIANEIIEALAITELNGTQRRILDVVIRQTYGYQRKSHALSISFISKATQLNNRQIQRELTRLIDRNIVIVINEATFNRSRELQLNKIYNTWLVGCEVANKTPGSELDKHTGSELDVGTGSELDTQRKKERKLKESTTEKKPAKFNTEDVEYVLSKYLYSKILLNDAKTKEPNLFKWAEDIDKLIRLDGRSVEEIENVIDYATEDSFWKSNILSANKLRAKFPQLYIKAKDRIKKTIKKTNNDEPQSIGYKGSGY